MMGSPTHLLLKIKGTASAPAHANGALRRAERRFAVAVVAFVVALGAFVLAIAFKVLGAVIGWRPREPRLEVRVWLDGVE